MATYSQIQQWVAREYGWQPKSCWIAHCKELKGLSLGIAPNRQGIDRRVPCPDHKQAAIFHAFRNFGMTQL